MVAASIVRGVLKIAMSASKIRILAWSVTLSRTANLALREAREAGKRR
jgi:hypothetical protein